VKPNFVASLGSHFVFLLFPLAFLIQSPEKKLLNVRYGVFFLLITVLHVDEPAAPCMARMFSSRYPLFFLLLFYIFLFFFIVRLPLVLPNLVICVQS